MLHDVAGSCSSALVYLRYDVAADLVPSLPGEPWSEALLDRLGPGLDLVWPDRPSSPENVERFLGEAFRRAVEGLNQMKTVEDVIPAAHWTDNARDLFLEHLGEEVDALVGGVHTEPIWMGFGNVSATEAITELTATGMLTKLRAVGEFLVGLPRSRYQDELRAADFFPAAKWVDLRTEELAEHVLTNQKLFHKQIAHVTITRPIPSEKWTYRPSSYFSIVTDLLALLQEFTDSADERLIPHWWREWTPKLSDQLLQE